jgi:dolichyl-phosphate beta-glucosyltransferase
MTAAPRLSVVVPAYNEEDRVEPTVRDIVRYGRERQRRFEVIVVDDGSRDGTSRVIDRLAGELPEVRLIRLAQNHGKGYAVRSGVVNARGRNILFADADGATPIAELERLEAALAAGADVAIGSRALHDVAVKVDAKWYRRLMGRSFHHLVELLAVRGFQDTQCGFKLFRGPVAHDLFSRMRMRGFSFDVEVLVMAQRQGYRVAEVPVNWVHQPGSRVNLAVDSLKMARDLFVIRRHCLSGLYRSPHLAAVWGAWSEAAGRSAPAQADLDIQDGKVKLSP